VLIKMHCDSVNTKKEETKQFCMRQIITVYKIIDTPIHTECAETGRHIVSAVEN
jgi:hypothetical protein